eukprot:3292841-Rhodomonas_salina.5
MSSPLSPPVTVGLAVATYASAVKDPTPAPMTFVSRFRPRFCSASGEGLWVGWACLRAIRLTFRPCWTRPSEPVSWLRRIRSFALEPPFPATFSLPFPLMATKCASLR